MHASFGTPGQQCLPQTEVEAHRQRRAEVHPGQTRCQCLVGGGIGGTRGIWATRAFIGWSNSVHHSRIKFDLGQVATKATTLTLSTSASPLARAALLSYGCPRAPSPPTQSPPPRDADPPPARTKLPRQKKPWQERGSGYRGDSFFKS